MEVALSQRIFQDFGLTPVIATEIEFYLQGIDGRLAPREVITLIEEECAKARLPLACAETERGPDQYEVSFRYSRDIARVISDTERFKSLMASVFASCGITADFAAKPMKDAPGSGLHVHVHLEDAEGKNVFYREGEEFSPQLLHSIGGLLDLMNAHMTVFAPHEESYDRFNYTVNDYLICPTTANVPLTVSWGTNNRTVAIRLPNKPMDNKHIEHRVAGSDADIGTVIAAIFMGIHHGISNKCDPGTPVYGDASLPQYGLPRLARSLEEAMGFKNECKALMNYPTLCAAIG